MPVLVNPCRRTRKRAAGKCVHHNAQKPGFNKSKHLQHRNDHCVGTCPPKCRSPTAITTSLGAYFKNSTIRMQPTAVAIWTKAQSIATSTHFFVFSSINHTSSKINTRTHQTAFQVYGLKGCGSYQQSRFPLHLEWKKCAKIIRCTMTVSIHLLQSRLYCRFWNFTKSCACALADFTADRGSHFAPEDIVMIQLSFSQWHTGTSLRNAAREPARLSIQDTRRFTLSGRTIHHRSTSLAYRHGFHVGGPSPHLCPAWSHLLIALFHFRQNLLVQLRKRLLYIPTQKGLHAVGIAAHIRLAKRLPGIRNQLRFPLH